MPNTMIVQITPLNGPLVGQPFSAKVDSLGTWGGSGEPFPTPPIAFPPGWIGGVPPTEPPPEQLPPASADWVYNEGWYFVWGPFDKPRPIGSSYTLDITKSGWKTMGQGWYFVSGPYDKPVPIFGEPVPPDTEPPTEPPVNPGCKWHFIGGGWILVCGPYDKPRPPGSGGPDVPGTPVKK